MLQHEAVGMVTVRTEPLEGADLEFENRPPLAQTPPPPCESLFTGRQGAASFKRARVQKKVKTLFVGARDWKGLPWVWPVWPDQCG